MAGPRLSPQQFVEQMVAAGCPVAFVVNPAGQAAIALAQGIPVGEVSALLRQVADDLDAGKVALVDKDPA